MLFVDFEPNIKSAVILHQSRVAVSKSPTTSVFVFAWNAKTFFQVDATEPLSSHRQPVWLGLPNQARVWDLESMFGCSLL